MKFSLFLYFLLGSAFAQETHHIRVRIGEAVPKVIVRGYDLRVYQTQSWGYELVSQIDKTSEWELRCQDGKIRAMALHRLDSKPIFDLKEPVSIQTPVGILEYGNQPYRDEIRIFSSGLLCEVINDVDLEKYLDGLVNSEFSSKWNEEAIQAQVIAARTYAYYQILESKKRKSRFDVDATVKDQVYQGSLREDYHSSRAVEKTKGLILTSQSGKAIKAFYHSTCGGLTELPEHVWGMASPGFKQQVHCPYCTGSPAYKWDLNLKKDEITHLILSGARKDGLLSGWPKNAWDWLKNGKLLSIRTGFFEKDQRVSKVITVWTKNGILNEFTIPAPRFREWVGFTKIRSTFFDVFVHSSRSEWHFQGRGNGHGVGMCQWGAKIMGEKGKKMAEILKFYYPDTILKKMW